MWKPISLVQAGELYASEYVKKCMQCYMCVLTELLYFLGVFSEKKTDSKYRISLF